MNRNEQLQEMSDMRELAPQIISGMKPYFDSLLNKDPETGLLYIFDEELGDRASCCTTGLAASLYALDGKINPGGDGLQIAGQLVLEVRRRQLPGGAFSQPFYAKKGEPEVVDIAEVGAVANSLYLVHKATGSLSAKESLLQSAEYLLTQVAVQNPAVILKRPGSDFDVLNGDMYAAHTFGRAYELSGNLEYLKKVQQIFTHLADRFGKNEKGWWPYIEHWDGSVHMGNSVLYQATIIALSHTALPLLSSDLHERWLEVSSQAVDTLVEAMRQPPSEATEAPWWTRDWSNGWELYWALLRSSSKEDVRRIGLNKFAEVAGDLAERRSSLFKPNIQNNENEQDRTPVTTTFRKAAGFAGIVANLILEELLLGEEEAIAHEQA